MINYDKIDKNLNPIFQFSYVYNLILVIKRAVLGRSMQLSFCTPRLIAVCINLKKIVFHWILKSA